MNKTAYSLILSDAVIREIDRLAYLRGTNRSGLVNQILAEYVSYVTPEQRQREVFRVLEDAFSERRGFRPLARSSQNLFSFTSALVYKYNPTVRYYVALDRNFGEELGEIRVAMRTQNPALLEALASFFLAWHRAESTYHSEISAVLEDFRYIRRLSGRRYQKEGMQNALGEDIVRYIRTLDRALKIYFELGPMTALSEQEVWNTYRNTYGENGAPF